MLLRLLERVPWQVSATAGWSALIAAPIIAEAWDREAPAIAASHSGRESAGVQIVDAAISAQLREDGFVIGLRPRKGTLDHSARP